jgi:hypothetical protein
MLLPTVASLDAVRGSGGPSTLLPRAPAGAAVAAALALGLMYLRTGDASAALALALPLGCSALLALAPDLLYARVLARGLVHWTAIAPTTAYVDAAVPPVLREWGGARGDDGPAVAVAMVQAAACMLIGLKWAGTADARAVAALTPVCVALSERLAGVSARGLGRGLWVALETVTAQTHLALALVLAGTGDLDALRRLRRVRGCMDKGPKGCQGLRLGTVRIPVAWDARGGTVRFSYGDPHCRGLSFSQRRHRQPRCV